MDSETTAELSVKLRNGLPFGGNRKAAQMIGVQLTQCSVADVVSAEPSSMAVHGVAVAAHSSGGGVAPLEPGQGVLFTPWEYSNQVHRSLVSTSHHQMVKTTGE